MRHRPIGIGVQGLADALYDGYTLFSDEAKNINKLIFETMYHAALEMSMEISKTNVPYSAFPVVSASKGILQFDMWNVTPSDRYDWNALAKNNIKTYELEFIYYSLLCLLLQLVKF